MTSQQAIFAETIVSMKRAIKRKSYEPDSDTSIDRNTNRGNKLRKKARFVREGQLAPPSGPQVYRRTIEYAGHRRDILIRKPPLVDEDGYEVDSDDDEERTQAAIVSAAQFNPYAQIKLEQILAPLTSPSELPNHPTLSKPFTSKALTNLTNEARDMLQKEKAFLWKLKHLMTRMTGDNTWVPCHIVEGDNDWTLFLDEQCLDHENIIKKTKQTEEECQKSVSGILTGEKQLSSDSIIAAVKNLIAKEQQDKNGTVIENRERFQLNNHVSLRKECYSNTDFSSNASKLNKEKNSIIPTNEKVLSNKSVRGEETLNEQEHVPTHHHMQTRAQAQAGSENATIVSATTSSDFDNESFIHPYFLAAHSSRPDHNLGLPQNEAMELRRVLQLYIQKQEEVCRGVQKIYDGLLKADRCRKLVIKWAKADGHVGVNRDMSDGEDWYDIDEWNLDENLRKGQDEEEEDAATSAKKTRSRRQ